MYTAALTTHKQPCTYVVVVALYIELNYFKKEKKNKKETASTQCIGTKTLYKKGRKRNKTYTVTVWDNYYSKKKKINPGYSTNNLYSRYSRYSR